MSSPVLVFIGYGELYTPTFLAYEINILPCFETGKKKGLTAITSIVTADFIFTSAQGQPDITELMATFTHVAIKCILKIFLRGSHFKTG